MGVAGAVEREIDAETHESLVVGGVEEFDFAHGACEFTEEEGRGVLVVPDVGAGAVAGAGAVLAALPAEEVAVGGSEDGLAAEG